MANTPGSLGEVGGERAPDQSLPQDSAPADLNLLFPWPEDQYSARWRRSFIASVTLHVILFSAGLRIGSLIHNSSAEPVVKRTVTPLYMPPNLVTQRSPNKAEISKNFDLADFLAAQQERRRVAAPAPGSVRRLQLPKENAKPSAKLPTPQISAEPPKVIAGNQPPPPGVADSVLGPVPPPPVPTAHPTPPAGTEPSAQNTHKLAPPKNSVSDILQQMAHGNSDSKVVVTDQGSPRGLPSEPGQQALQGHLNSAIELQSDPQGADFRPYLKEILAIVRRNWFSVLPSSARAGMLRGRTTIQFVVNKDGSIPKLVIADSSGLQPLDRAAVAGMSMSNPLPPLPADFKGEFVRLQFSFNYNVPAL
ncbi:MAG: TonB family protein [Bryobacteraceae bacterium]